MCRARINKPFPSSLLSLLSFFPFVFPLARLAWRPLQCPLCSATFHIAAVAALHSVRRCGDGSESIANKNNRLAAPPMSLNDLLRDLEDEPEQEASSEQGTRSAAPAALPALASAAAPSTPASSEPRDYSEVYDLQSIFYVYRSTELQRLLDVCPRSSTFTFSHFSHFLLHSLFFCFLPLADCPFSSRSLPRSCRYLLASLRSSVRIPVCLLPLPSSSCAALFIIRSTHRLLLHRVPPSTVHSPHAGQRNRRSPSRSGSGAAAWRSSGRWRPTPSTCC